MHMSQRNIKRKVKRQITKKCKLFSLSFIFLLMYSLSAVTVSAEKNTSLISPDFIPQCGFLLPSPEATLPTAIDGTSAQAAVLINASTGEILFRQNENARLPMASTTKIMTALIAVENMPLTELISVDESAVGIEGSSIYLTVGEKLTLRDLLYAMMLESANDAAAAIAVAVAGSVSEFAELMNQKAKVLGLKDTHFMNPHGLDDSEHYTTAYELALITMEAMRHDSLRKIMSTVKTTIPHDGHDGVRLLLNHNKLLRDYEGSIGVKTGFTKKSGRCLVSAASNEGTELIAVTLNAPDDWNDHTKMLDYGFALYDRIDLCKAGAFRSPLWVVGSDNSYVLVSNSDHLTVSLPKLRGDIRCVVELPRFIYAPVKMGDPVGRLVFYEIKHTGELQYLCSTPLYAEYDITPLQTPKTLLDRLSDLFGF